MAQEKVKPTLQEKKEKIIKEIKEYNQNATKEEKIKVLDENFLEEHLSERKEIKEVKVITDSNDPIPFATLKNPPAFQGCEEKTDKDARECFMTGMNNHIKTNFSYPKEAQEKNVEGRVVVMFTINKEGYVDDFRIRGSETENGYLIEQEATRIMKLLPKFKPGMIEGKPVAVSYAQPIMFKLQKQEQIKPIEVKE